MAKVVIPDVLHDYVMSRASMTGYEPETKLTSTIRGRKETHTIAEWTYLLDDDVDYLIYLHEKAQEAHT